MKKPKSVKNYMAKKLITFTPETNVSAAIRILLKNKIQKPVKGNICKLY